MVPLHLYTRLRLKDWLKTGLVNSTKQNKVAQKEIRFFFLDYYLEGFLLFCSFLGKCTVRLICLKKRFLTKLLIFKSYLCFCSCCCRYFLSHTHCFFGCQVGLGLKNCPTKVSGLNHHIAFPPFENAFI